MINGQGEWHRLRKILYEKRKSKKKRVNKRKTKIIMGEFRKNLKIEIILYTFDRLVGKSK